jgi:acyl carrier protein
VESGAAAAPAASAASAPPHFPGAAGSEGILSREGVEALRRLLARGRRLPQVAVSAKGLEALFEQVRALSQSGLTDRPGGQPGGAGAASRPSHPRPALSTPYAAPRTDVESRLASIFQGALGIEEVGIHDNFFDLGGDSMVGIQVVARANEMQLQLSPDQLFEHQTIAELAALLPAGADLPEPSPMSADAAGAAAAAAGAHGAEIAASPPDASQWPASADAAAVAPAPAFADSGLSADDLSKVLAKLAGPA